MSRKSAADPARSNIPASEWRSTPSPLLRSAMRQSPASVYSVSGRTLQHRT